MDELRDWPAVLSPPQRNNFFFGKMMGVAQFEREQCYGMGQRWLINRLTIGTGVLCGLEVTLTADGKRLRDIEREALELTLQLTDYNQSAAARILCISRPTLARKLKAYGLSKEASQ